MSQHYDYTNNDYLTQATSTGAFSIASGLSQFNSHNPTPYDPYPGGNTYSGASNGTVSQIAQDLLQLNTRAANTNISVCDGVSQCLSAVEAAILRSSVPIDIGETEEITVNGQRGIWANKQESINWRGLVPLSQYAINEDSNPEIITKRSQQQLVYQQEVAIRYLRPPTPPAPGEIIIQQEINTLTPPAPPLVIRQQPPRPVTPQPLVVREAPPQPPTQIGKKVITISGKRIPPPPRKVVIERLAPLPSKPQSVIIERWLPYSQVKRRVIYQKANERDPVICKPKNVIIQWEAPTVQVKKEFKDLGVIRANPAEYVARYGSTLKQARELPSFVLEIKPPAGVILAADYQYNSVYELEGDVQALRLIDLDREGLSEYKNIVQRLGITDGSSSVGAIAAAPSVNVVDNSSYAATSSTLKDTSSLSGLITEIFNSIDRDNNGRISVEEAEKVLLRLNSRLGRRYGEDDTRRLFDSLDINRDGFIDLVEFKRAFESQL